MRHSFFYIALACLLFAGATQAESFYKWVDSRGVTHYGEAPPEDAPTDVVDVTGNRPRTAAAPQTEKGMVVLYSLRNCKECDAARSYFKSHNIRFAEYDVEDSARGKEDYRRLRAKGVPIILLDDQRLDGFTPAAFEKLAR